MTLRRFGIPLFSFLVAMVLVTSTVSAASSQNIQDDRAADRERFGLISTASFKPSLRKTLPRYVPRTLKTGLATSKVHAR